MTIKEVVKKLEKSPGLRFDSHKLAMYEQSAANLLFWITISSTPEAQRHHRRKIKKTNDWEVSRDSTK